MTTIIAVMNPKGGVAKTTTTINLAAYLSQAFSVALVDMDPQASIETWLGKAKKYKVYTAKRLAHVTSLPTNPRATAFDFIIIDTPASLKARYVHAVAAISHFVVVPCKASMLDVQASLKFIDGLLIPSQIPFKLLLTQVLASSNHSDHIRSYLLEQRIPVFSSSTRYYQTYMHAVEQQKSVFEMGYLAAAAQNDYQNIARELLESIRLLELPVLKHKTLSGD